MKVTHVALRPTEAAEKAGAPALTPELLAATGARYSRSNEGLFAILDRIDPEHPDKSVDSIFRMVDYGHQSIADMVPAAMFLDGISIHLAYYVWSLCSVAGGQESSTRYLDLSTSTLPDPEALGISDGAAWQRLMTDCFGAYRMMLEEWQALAEKEPELTRIPGTLRDDPSPKAVKAVARMRRNYAFDRARYFLPAAVPTNVMLVMSARSWVQLCQHLASQPLREANDLAVAIKSELALCSPRLIKHACSQESIAKGIRQEHSEWRRMASEMPACLVDESLPPDHDAMAHLAVLGANGLDGEKAAEDLAGHDNRYAWIGSGLRQTAVRFGWDAVTLAELRDLNRHRTGSKYCPQVPMGFYSAMDQVPDSDRGRGLEERLAELAEIGRDATRAARTRLADGDPAYIYWALLGTQYPFEHVTTADKFIYEAELRTGVGSHYRYAQHLHDALKLWYREFPETTGLIHEGTAEPE
jgi:thymidylate synthase ThyX